MTVLERKEQIQEEQQKAFEELQVAQNRVTELTALIQRQNGPRLYICWAIGGT